MHARIAAALIAVSAVAAACTMIMTPLSPTRTLRPTITSTVPVTPTVVLFFPSTARVAPLTPAPSQTAAGALTATAPLTSAVRPVAQPLAITTVLLVKVERDHTRPNGALASIQVVYNGGRAPYRIFHDDSLQIQNPFIVLTDCNSTLVHTLRLASGDGQTVSKQYYLSPVECPP